MYSCGDWGYNRRKDTGGDEKENVQGSRVADFVPGSGGGQHPAEAFRYF